MDSPESKNPEPGSPGEVSNRSDPAKHNLLKAPAFWIPIAVSLVALGTSFVGTYNSSRSATASEMSAKAALTNAGWASYQLNPHHDLTARVLNVGFHMAGYPSGSTNGTAFVDLALINNGNQSEIVRRVTQYYFDSPELAGGSTFFTQDLNTQLAKGEKQVLHLALDHRVAFTGKFIWLRIGVTAIGIEAEDLESTFPVASFSLAPDGNGGSVSPMYTNSTSIVSDQKLPTQHPVPMTMY